MGPTVNNNRSTACLEKECNVQSIRDFPMIVLINMEAFKLHLRFSAPSPLNVPYGGSL